MCMGDIRQLRTSVKTEILIQNLAKFQNFFICSKFYVQLGTFYIDRRTHKLKLSEKFIVEAYLQVSMYNIKFMKTLQI